MAVELFDPSQIDSAVGDAFGTKVKTRPAPAPTAAPKTPAPIRTNNPGALMPGGKLAEYGSMEEGLAALDKNLASYGKKGINTLSGVISTWAPPKENDTNAYIAHVAKVTGLDPNQPIDLSSPLVRHQISAGITQMESGRKAVFSHSNQSSAAPSTAAPSSASTTEFSGIKEQDINSAVNDAFKNPEPPKPGVIEKTTGKVASKVGEFFRGQGRAAASLADTAINAITGTLDVAAYPLARAYYGTQMSPEAAAEKAKAETTSPKNVVGRAFGVSETPQYKGEASQQLMNYIGANMDKGADVIAKETGLPKADVESYMNTLLLATPSAVKAAGQTKLGQVVKNEAGYAGQAVKQGVQAVTPGFVQRGVVRAAEAVAPGITGVKAPAAVPGVVPPVAGQPPQAAPYAQPGGGRASVGAAATPDATIIKQALQTATPEFQQLYGNMALDKVNTPVVLRHLEADSLDVPMRLTEGQATGDLVKISKEQNLRGKNTEYAYRFQEQNQNLIDNLQRRRELAAPDVFAPKTIDSSQALIDSYKKIDTDSNAAIEAAGTKLKEAAGGDLPIDAKTLKENIDKQLEKELLLTDGQGISQYKELMNLAEQGQMTFDQYLAMRRNLSKLSGTASDGNVRFAAGLMVRQLDKLPLTKETAALKPFADARRNLARERFDALDNDPAYKAAVFDTVSPDKFFNKYVINGHNKNVNTMIDALGRDSLAHQHIKAGTINWLSDNAGVVNGKGNFSQANYNQAVKRLDDVNNFDAIFDPESQLKLRTLGNVANYTQFQPRGAFVNNSNTLVGYLANKAAGGLETAGNLIGLKTIGYPLGSEGRRVIQGARERAEVEKSLQPGAGSTLENVKNKGK